MEGALRPLVQTPPDGASEGPLLEDAGPGVSEEDVALCQQLRVAAEQQLAQRQSKQSTSLFGFKPQATNEDREALEAVRKLVAALEAYDALARVLRGSFVPGLLGPVPPGYVSARLRVLARDRSPLQAFQWDAGMTWAGRAWRAGSMPTDSALLLYVLACFLDAPDWDFVARAEHRRPGAAPLFLGHLPHGTVPGTMQYSAILEGAQVSALRYASGSASWLPEVANWRFPLPSSGAAHGGGACAGAGQVRTSAPVPAHGGRQARPGSGWQGWQDGVLLFCPPLAVVRAEAFPRVARRPVARQQPPRGARVLHAATTRAQPLPPAHRRVACRIPNWGDCPAPESAFSLAGETGAPSSRSAALCVSRRSCGRPPRNSGCCRRGRAG